MLKPIVVSLLAFVSPALFAQQPPAPAAPAQTAEAASQGAVYSILQPAVGSVLTTLEGLKIEKWKKGSVRDEAAQNVEALERDIHTNLPPLVSAADSASGSLSQAMPLMKHLDALYDVLLRVEEASRVIAPGDQVTQLQQSLLKLSQARIALDDQLQSQAATQEKQIADLQAALKAQEAKAQTTKTVAADTTCKPAPAPKKRKKPAAATSKSATPAASGQKPQ